MRKVRRFGEEFAMAADRTTAAKFVKNHHKQPPGVHGAKRIFKKHTGYGLQLQEKQKAKIFYHIGEKQLRRAYTEALRQAGSASDNLPRLLESRIDNVIYRAGLANSHPAARQLVAHRQFKLNGILVSIPSIRVKSGDVIEDMARIKITRHYRFAEGDSENIRDSNSASPGETEAR